MVLVLNRLTRFCVSHQLSDVTHHSCFLKFKALFLFAGITSKKVTHAI